MAPEALKRASQHAKGEKTPLYQWLEEAKKEDIARGQQRVIHHCDTSPASWTSASHTSPRCNGKRPCRKEVYQRYMGLLTVKPIKILARQQKRPPRKVASFVSFDLKLFGGSARESNPPTPSSRGTTDLKSVAIRTDRFFWPR